MRGVAVLSLLLLLLVAVPGGPAAAHDPLNDLPAPTSVPEAWNVISASIDNIATCLQTGQLKEIAAHVSNCSPALRVLQADAKRRNDQALWDRLEALYYSGDAIITASRQKSDAAPQARGAYDAHRAAVTALARAYPADVVGAQVYVCPMHPLERSLDPATPCPKCSMKLIRRRIPASTTYERPGAPSMKLTATLDHPLKVGEKATVTVNLAKLNGAPVAGGDLLTMHTQKIHLLIIDASLADYHHEHPTPSDKPGEYTFAFVPNRPGPYRIFADVVPGETSVQEYVVTDLPADTRPEPVTDKVTSLAAEVDDYIFSLRFDADAGGKLHTNTPTIGRLTVAAPDGQPFKELEPVMGAFAHLVAFNEDGKTVLHIHPEGPELQNPAVRGGPLLTFKLYAPAAGFYRLYAQTQIAGRPRFARFSVTVEP